MLLFHSSLICTTERDNKPHIAATVALHSTLARLQSQRSVFTVYRPTVDQPRGLNARTGSKLFCRRFAILLTSSPTSLSFASPPFAITQRVIHHRCLSAPQLELRRLGLGLGVHGGGLRWGGGHGRTAGIGNRTDLPTAFTIVKMLLLLLLIVRRRSNTFLYHVIPPDDLTTSSTD